MKVSKDDKRADQQPSPDEGKVQRLSKTRSQAEVSRVGRKLEARGSSDRIIGIYAIVCLENGKVYVGKSINVRARLMSHKCALRSKTRRKKHTNRRLYEDVQKFGWECFECYVLEEFDSIDEDLIASRELHWMKHLNATDRNQGYNLRLDSETKMITHEDTRKLLRVAMSGENNPNYANYWNDDQKRRMSEIAKERHSRGIYKTERILKMRSETSRNTWKDPEKKRKMAKKVSEKRRVYNFLQYTRDGDFVRKWESVEDIINSNPGYKWQNIYSVCNGYKPTYMGYVWKKELKI